MRGFTLILFVFAASVANAVPLPQDADYTSDNTLDLGDYVTDGSVSLGDYTTDGTLTGDVSTDAMDYVQDLGQDIRKQDGDYYTYDPSSDLPDMTTWTQAERTGYLTNRVQSSHDMTMGILNNWSSSSSSVFI